MNTAKSTAKPHNDQSPALLKQLQLFIKVGQNRYVPIYTPESNTAPLYTWDEACKQIIPYKEDTL